MVRRAFRNSLISVLLILLSVIKTNRFVIARKNLLSFLLRVVLKLRRLMNRLFVLKLFLRQNLVFRKRFLMKFRVGR